MAEPEKRKAMGGAKDRSPNPGEETLQDRYPGLAKYVLIDWPWGEAEDIWLEHMTGEPQGKRRGTPDSDL